MKGLVFLNRTTDGMMKRHHLEEVISDQLPFTAQFSQLGVASNQLIGYRLPLHVDSAIVFKSKLEGLFLERYLAAESSLRWRSPCSSLKEMVSLGSRGKVLETSLQAFWITRMGHDTANQDMYMQGKQKYGEALSQLNRQLSRPGIHVDDELLSTVKLLILYEVSIVKHPLSTSRTELL